MKRQNSSGTVENQKSILSFFKTGRDNDDLEQDSSATENTPTVDTGPELPKRTDETADKVKRKRPKFQTAWLKYPDGSPREWLNYDDLSDSMTCKYCIERYGGRGASVSSSFIVGCTSFRYTSVLSHEQSDNHHTAQQAHLAKQKLPAGTPIEQGFMRMEEGEFEKRKKQFNSAFHLAISELPFSQFVPILQLQDKNFNCDLSSNYSSDKQCKIFTQYIAEVYKRNLQTLIKNNDFISTLNDSSTDTGVIEQELVYVRLLDDDYEPVTIFASIKNVPVANAEGIKAAVIDSLENDGQCDDWRDKLVFCAVDGASVMTGKINGMVAKIKEESPHMLGIHCTNHRLELALKDAVKSVPLLAEVDNTLQELYKLYHYSAKMWTGLQTSSEALGIKILKPPKITGTRWIAHRERAVNALIRDWPAIVTHLSQVELLTTDQAPRAKGLKKTLTAVHFVLFLKLLAEHVYPRIATMSCVLQQNTATLETVQVHMESTLLHLQSLNVKQLLEKEGQKLADNKWHGIQLHVGMDRRNTSQPTIKAVAEGTKLVTAIQETIKKRFDSFTLQNKDVFESFSSIFEPRHWPDERTNFPTYGNSELAVLEKQYGDLLVKKGYCLTSLRAELTELMVLVSTVHKKYKSLTFNVWPSILRMKMAQESGCDSLKNIFSLLHIAMCMPVSTAEAERGFSLMLRVKNDFRSRLSNNALSDQMRIKLVGGNDVTKFDAEPAIKLWYGAGKRRLTAAYGRRSKKSKTEADDHVDDETSSDDEY